jgi:hypothetical protein
MKRDVRDICTQRSYLDEGCMSNDKNVNPFDEDTRLEQKRILSHAKQTSSWSRGGGYVCNYRYIRRFIEKNVGRAWNDVFSELCKVADSRQLTSLRVREEATRTLISLVPCHVSKTTGNLVDAYGKIVTNKASIYQCKKFYVDDNGILCEFVPQKVDPKDSPKYYQYTPPPKIDPFNPSGRNMRIKANQYLVGVGSNHYIIDTIDISKVSPNKLFTTLMEHGDVILNMRHPKGYPEYYKLNPELLEKDLRAIYSGDLVLGYRKSAATQSILNENWKQPVE